MTRFYVELQSQLSLTEVTFDSWRWTSFISKTFIGSVYWDLVLVNRNANSLYSKWRNAKVHYYADYISFAAATVWAGKADLPSTIELWRRQHDKVVQVEDRGGYGKIFNTRMLSERKVTYFIHNSIAIFAKVAQRWCCQIWRGRGDASIYVFKFSWKKWCMLLLLLDWQYPECVFSFWNSICFPWLFLFSLSTDEIEAIWDKAQYFPTAQNSEPLVTIGSSKC